MTSFGKLAAFAIMSLAKVHRFGHDRYQQASQSLTECQDIEKMHFVIAQTMMKYSKTNSEECSMYAQARHICQAIDVIKRRIAHRSRFRKVLCKAAHKAIESGARPTASWYYENCLRLLQSDPWDDKKPDVYYDETLDLYTRAAELYWHQGLSSEALDIISSTFAHARTAADKAPSWILQSRVFAQRGNSHAAFNALKTSLTELGLVFEKTTSWNECDQEYQRLHKKLEYMEHTQLVSQPQDPKLVAMGAVMVEAISAAFWSDSLLFYQMAIKMIEVHLQEGSFIQVGLGFCYFGMIIVSRFSDIPFCKKLCDAGIQLLKRCNDPYTIGRGLAVSALFCSHILTPIRDHLADFKEALEYTLVSGDKIVFLICVGGLASYRLYLGHEMSELESFCNYAAEDFGDWTYDLKGGVLLTAVRQIARSLQGKTSPIGSLNDDKHNTDKYMDYIGSHASTLERPRDMYNSLAMIPAYLFGQYEQAVRIGDELRTTAPDLWSMRNRPLALFYLSLASLALARECSGEKKRSEIISTVQKYKAEIDSWQAECSVNSLMWSLLIKAETAGLTGDFECAIQAFEAAIDHCQVYDFALEEALAFELQGEFFIRRGAKRAGRSNLEEALSAYTRISAGGKVRQLRMKYEWLLTTATKARTHDIAIQTADSVGEIGNTTYRVEENARQQIRDLGPETSSDRTEIWLNPKIRKRDADVSGLGLDVVDLQSILEFNQAISSELHIDRLLAKMTQIILESAGGHFAGVVIKSEDEVTSPSWCFAASGTQDGLDGQAIPLNEVKDATTKQVVSYTLRFREAVFVQNVLVDERFSPTASSAKSVISLPIIHGSDVLGVLYLEGQPNAFTPRNLDVLQLFCNQVGISITNALLFKKIRKVSAANNSMIESQKRALKVAHVAEDKSVDSDPLLIIFSPSNMI